MNDTHHDIRAPRGPALSARSWLTEAPLRMLMNNLDPEVAERPDDLVVYGGIGRAARNWDCYDRIVRALRALGDDETLLVQSGKPVGVFRTHADAPRVLIANSNLVGRWATWDHFHELDRKGLMMYGQMTAGSWIYIGSQGIVQGTYETFVEMGRQHYGGDLAGRWILTAGLGGMGGAQPLAATMAGASMLAVECRPERIEKRLDTRYLDLRADTLDEALAIIDARDARAARPISVGLLGNAAEVLPELLRRGVRPDAVTDQTSAHDPVNGYLPEGWTLEQWDRLRTERPARGRAGGAALDGEARRGDARLPEARHPASSTTATTSARWRSTRASKDAFAFPGFVPAYVRPLFCRGIGPFRWAALSGNPKDIYRTDAEGEGADPGRPAPAPLARHGARAHPVPGPAGAHLLGRPRPASSPRPRLQRDGRARRTQGAGRDRPRSPRLRLGREPEPRDRSDARRLGRRVRLAAAQRAAQHRERRHLGVDPPRRRRRHRLFAARRRRDRLRRHAGRGASASSACCGTTRPPA